jgi:hypothetical protein
MLRSGRSVASVAAAPMVQPCSPLSHAENHVNWQWTQQQFGFHINTPVAISYGPTENWCWAVHNNANLKNDTYRYPRGGGPECGADWQPGFWWCATWSNELQSCECGAC